MKMALKNHKVLSQLQWESKKAILTESMP